jgi:hypothetical protein
MQPDVGDAALPKETCFFWDVRAGICRYEMLFLGCEPCSACPGEDEPARQAAGAMFTCWSDYWQADICGNCGIPVSRHGGKCGVWT